MKIMSKISHQQSHTKIQSTIDIILKITNDGFLLDFESR